MKPVKHIQTILTPEGPLNVVTPVAEQLLANAVISGTLDGELHATNAATVKAAMLRGAGICDFCAAPGPSHTIVVADFDLPEVDAPLPDGASVELALGRSTGGWAACDICHTLVEKRQKQALLDRALMGAAFPKFARTAVTELHRRFWEKLAERDDAVAAASAVSDYVADKIPNAAATISDRDKRVEAMARATGLTKPQVEALASGEAPDLNIITALTLWKKSVGKGVTDPRKFLDLVGEPGPRKPLPDLVPHWQRALDMRFAALESLRHWTDKAKTMFYSPEAVDLNDPDALERIVTASRAKNELVELGYLEDVKFLRAAEAYSFNQETTAAIREAAQSVPQETPLSAIETPNTGAGWFWFQQPLPVAASPVVSDAVNALLWGWTERVVTESSLDVQHLADYLRSKDVDPAAVHRLHALIDSLPPDGSHPQNSEDAARLAEIFRELKLTEGELAKFLTSKRVTYPAIIFSAYVLDEQGFVKKGVPLPSTRWTWPLEMSFKEMLAYNEQNWDNDYGEQGKSAYKHKGGPLMGKESTMLAVADLSLFFVMACLWFRQTVPGTGRKVTPKLTQESGHVERHARKRFMKDHNLPTPPKVQVVALRRTERTAASDAPEHRQEGAREYHCHWIVKGHPRLQPVGPGRKERKLIWIDAHPAGPLDKPLRTRDRVYAVVR